MIYRRPWTVASRWCHLRETRSTLRGSPVDEDVFVYFFPMWPVLASRDLHEIWTTRARIICGGDWRHGGSWNQCFFDSVWNMQTILFAAHSLNFVWSSLKSNCKFNKWFYKNYINNTSLLRPEHLLIYTYI